MPISRDGSASGLYTIGDLAKIYGVSLRTLRFYEERELMQPRRDGYRRVYTEEDRRRLETILKAKRLGFSLAAIWKLVDARGKETGLVQPPIDALGLSDEEIGIQIERLQRERERVVSAIEELREVASGYGGQHRSDGSFEKRDDGDEPLFRAALSA